MANEVRFARLSGTLVRRADRSFDHGYRDAAAPDEPQAGAKSGLLADLRLFAITWAAGFLFFITLLA